MPRGLNLYINLKAVIENYRTINKHLKSGRSGAAVKANAYGLGAIEISRVLYQEGCRDFFVARLEEGVELAKNLPSSAGIYVLEGVTSAAHARICQENNLIPVLNSLSHIKTYASVDGPLPCVLHFDTGMNRLGLTGTETDKIINAPALLSALSIHAIMTHPVAADDRKDHFTATQFEKFAKIRAAFPHIPASFCNSAALFTHNDYHLDLARPGYALYGGNPFLNDTAPIKNVVHLDAPILQIQKVNKNQSIGYGRSYYAQNKCTIAAVGIGYADGLMRSLGNKGYVYVHGHKCAIRGRVSMDIITIDITDIDSPVFVGDKAEILGPNQNIDDLARHAGTIGYELLTTLGNSCKKCYSETY